MKEEVAPVPLKKVRGAAAETYASKTRHPLTDAH